MWYMLSLTARLTCFVSSILNSFQAQLGVFQEHLDDNIVSVLLDAGVLFLLRWALDDSSDAVMAAAIQCFTAILIVPSDKVCIIINPVTPRQLKLISNFNFL